MEYFVLKVNVKYFYSVDISIQSSTIPDMPKSRDTLTKAGNSAGNFKKRKTADSD